MQQFGEMLGFKSQPFTTSSGDNNNVPVSSTVLTVTTASNGDRITGMVPLLTSDVALCFVVNIHATNSLVLPHNSTASDSGFRFFFFGGTNLTLAPGQTAVCARTAIGWAPILQGTLS